jgi:hypothetical protein
MLERKKFGAKGYNMSYPFSIGDLVCSASVLRNYMETAPVKVLHLAIAYSYFAYFDILCYTWCDHGKPSSHAISRYSPHRKLSSVGYPGNRVTDMCRPMPLPSLPYRCRGRICVTCSGRSCTGATS